MKSVHDQIRDHALVACGYREPINIGRLDVLRKSEWSPRFERIIRGYCRVKWSYEFEQHMRDGLLMGVLHYGKLNASGKPHWDRLSDIEYRWGEYCRTKNKMFLVDIANFCLLEFEEGDGRFSSAWRPNTLKGLAFDYRITKNNWCLIEIAGICIKEFSEGRGHFTPTENTKKVEVQ